MHSDQHRPWIGPSYGAGIEGQHICIAGYSHWKDEVEQHTAECTHIVLRKVIEGPWKDIAFFKQIRNYFGFEEHAALWNRVIFFNYIQECMESKARRFESGTPEQVKHANERFLALIREHRPQKVFIFTSKGWWTFPPTCEEQAGQKGRMALDPRQFPAAFTWGTYDGGGSTVMAFGLRHTQGATGDLMRRAVRYIMNKPIIGWQPT